MYCPSHFAETNVSALQKTIQNNPFGLLVTHGAAGLDANHLPFLLLPEQGNLGVLHAHVARNNPVWQALQNDDEVLVVFQAGNAYISPQWYPSKQETHKQVPTWNYIVVHARGKVTLRDDEKFVRGVVGRLTRIHEASQAKPWKMSDAPKEYIDKMVEAIVGIEIQLTALVGKSKLSQNKELPDVQGAGAALNVNGHAVIGDAMLAAAAIRASASS